MIGVAAATAATVALGVTPASPSHALSVPIVGQIPGTEALPLDVGMVVERFGGKQLLDLAEALANGDPAALVQALEGAQLLALAEALGTGDLDAAIRTLDGGLHADVLQAITTGDWLTLLDLLDRDTDGDGIENHADLAKLVTAIQDGDLPGAVTALGGGVLVRTVTGVSEGNWLEVLDALDRDADGDGLGDTRVVELVQAIQAGDIVTIAGILGAFAWLNILAASIADLVFPSVASDDQAVTVSALRQPLGHDSSALPLSAEERALSAPPPIPTVEPSSQIVNVVEQQHERIPSASTPATQPEEGTDENDPAEQVDQPVDAHEPPELRDVETRDVKAGSAGSDDTSATALTGDRPDSNGPDLDTPAMRGPERNVRRDSPNPSSASTSSDTGGDSQNESGPRAHHNTERSGAVSDNSDRPGGRAAVGGQRTNESASNSGATSHERTSGSGSGGDNAGGDASGAANGGSGSGDSAASNAT